MSQEPLEYIAEPLRGHATPVDDLTLWDRNPRRADVEAIMRIFTEVGQWLPIIYQVDPATELRIVKIGNHRLRAARQLEWTHIAAIDGSALTAEQMTAFALADNQLNLLGTSDEEAIAGHLADLASSASPALIGATGFTEDAIEALLAAAAAVPEADDKPEPVQAEKEITSRPGDLWTLGPHRLLVGSSTERPSWETLFDGAPGPAAVWTDPPYGVAYVGKTPDALEILNDDLNPEQLEQLLDGAFRLAVEFTRPGASWWVAAPSGPSMLPFAKVLQELEIWRQILVWEKDSMVLGHSDYHAKHELIFWGAGPGTWVPDATFGVTTHEMLVYGWTPGAPHHTPDDRKQTSVLNFDRPKASRDHPTMKPPDLIEYCLSHSKPGPVVDMFAGSGSTMVAAHRIGRKAFMFERDPKYADVICRRWQTMAGELPERNGQPVDFATDAEEPADTEVPTGPEEEAVA